MRPLTPDEIDGALGRLRTGFDRYLWIQEHVRQRNVSTDREFQTRFDAFYRVWRGESWRTEYFTLMEFAKNSDVDFPQALGEINRRTGRIEASFASKLVATLHPAMPVIDKFVLQNFGLRLPTWGSRDRESRTVEVYRALCGSYEDLLRSATATAIQQQFDRRFPASGITALKKVDLVLWQIRDSSPDRYRDAKV